MHKLKLNEIVCTLLLAFETALKNDALKLDMITSRAGVIMYASTRLYTLQMHFQTGAI